MGEDKRSLLEEQIEGHLLGMQNLEPGTDEMTKATKELDILYKLAEEADSAKHKSLSDHEEAVRNDRKFDFEKEKFAYQKKQDLVKTSTEVGLGLAGLATSIWAFCKGCKFETDGVFKATSVKQVLNKILKFR